MTEINRLPSHMLKDIPPEKIPELIKLRDEMQNAKGSYDTLLAHLDSIKLLISELDLDSVDIDGDTVKGHLILDGGATIPVDDMLNVNGTSIFAGNVTFKQNVTLEPLPLNNNDLVNKSYVDIRSLPPGGIRHQILMKQSENDYDSNWININDVGNETITSNIDLTSGMLDNIAISDGSLQLAPETSSTSSFNEVSGLGFEISFYVSSGKCIAKIDTNSFSSSSKLYWKGVQPPKTRVLVYTKITDDNINEPTIWTTQQNGFSINEYAPNKYLWIKIELLTESSNTTPYITSMYLGEEYYDIKNKYAKKLTGYALPIATEEYRGENFTILGETNAKDKIYVCVKNSNDTYEWIETLNNSATITMPNDVEFENGIWNSDFEWYDSNNVPNYWFGTGKITKEQKWRGSTSLKLEPGQKIEQGMDENFNLVGVDPIKWSEKRTRVSFQHKGGAVRVKIKRYILNE